MQIELKVDGHPSGRMTLKRRNQNDMGFKDYQPGGPLFGNDDAGTFYRAVAQELANLTAQGHDVQYQDIQSLDDSPARAVAEFEIGKSLDQ